MYQSYRYDDRTTSTSPWAYATHGRYSAQRSEHTATPPPRSPPISRARYASQDSTYIYTYADPQQWSYHEQASPRYASSPRGANNWIPEYVYSSDRLRNKARQFREASGEYDDRYRHCKPRPSNAQHIHSSYDNDFFHVREEEYLPTYGRAHHYSSIPRDARHPAYRSSEGDGYAYYSPESILHRTNEQSSHPSPTRRASHTSKPRHTQGTKSRSKPARPAPQATPSEAFRAGIPAKYSLTHWDPSEKPILLLGSAFDANSLGKWIYDWTVASHGSASPMSDIAGDLWLLLIQLAGKIRRAEEGLTCVRTRNERDLLHDFLDAGDRLWGQFKKLLKICEVAMLKAARKSSANGTGLTLGKRSGREFVACIFGRDRELQRTEKWRTAVRLWSMRYDANCEDVLRDADV